MEHLKIDDIIAFVSAEKLDQDFLELSMTVNGHIRECDECMELVNAFQLLYDEFKKLQNRGGFGKYVVAASGEDDKLARSLQDAGFTSDREENK